MHSNRILKMVEIAVFAGLAFVLDLIKVFEMPYGGSITLGMIPVLIVALRWGLKAGLVAGLIYGTLQAIFYPYMVSIIQVIFEYPVAFTAIGLAGIFSKPMMKSLQNNEIKRAVLYAFLGVFLGCFVRFMGHFIAGLVWFREFTPEQFDYVWLYSILYNGAYMLPSFLLSFVVVMILLMSRPKIFIKNA